MAGYMVGNIMIQIDYEHNIALGHPKSIIIRVRASKGEVVLFWVFWLHNPKQLGNEMQKPKWCEELTCKEDSAK